jgi:hypothetical protein
MGQAGRKAAADRHDEAAWVETYLAIYADLLGGPGNTAARLAGGAGTEGYSPG